MRDMLKTKEFGGYAHQLVAYHEDDNYAGLSP